MSHRQDALTGTNYLAGSGIITVRKNCARNLHLTKEHILADGAVNGLKFGAWAYNACIHCAYAVRCRFYVNLINRKSWDKV